MFSCLIWLFWFLVCVVGGLFCLVCACYGVWFAIWFGFCVDLWLFTCGCCFVLLIVLDIMPMFGVVLGGVCSVC